MAEVSVVVPTCNLKYSGLLGRKIYAQGAGEMTLQLQVLASKPKFNPKTHTVEGRPASSSCPLTSTLAMWHVLFLVHMRLINKTNKLKFLEAKCCPE